MERDSFPKLERNKFECNGMQVREDTRGLKCISVGLTVVRPHFGAYVHIGVYTCIYET